MPVKIEGYLMVPQTRLAAVVEALPEHIELTRKEEGCESFNVTQDPENPNRLDVREVFRDEAAFEHHKQRSRNSRWWDESSTSERHFDITNTEQEK